jgi:Gpi18-like mannosyltransferase
MGGNLHNARANRLTFPLAIFSATWAFLWIWMRLARAFYAGDLSPDPVFRPYLGVAPATHAWLEVWQRWDVLHYQAIATHGYQAFSTALFTPPLYPALMRLASLFLHGNTLLAGLLVSALACAAALVAFYQLAIFELGEEKVARRALVYFVLFPTSFFLFAPYTESLFLLGSIAALHALRQKKWLVAGLWAALAAASRLTGALILLPIAWAAWQEWKQRREYKAWLTVAFPLLTAISFPLYAWLGLGESPWAPFLAQSARFHGGFTFPGINILAAIRQIFTHQYPLPNLLDVTFTLAFVIYAVPVWKELPRLYGVYYLGFLALYLTRIAEIYPLLSMTRYVLALYPAFFVLARQGENPLVHRALVYAFTAGLLFLSAQFAIWGWVG